MKNPVVTPTLSFQWILLSLLFVLLNFAGAAASVTTAEAEIERNSGVSAVTVLTSSPPPPPPCRSWKRRGGSDIVGSRNQTESGFDVDISDDGRIVSIEEYGDNGGPYKQNGHGTGRLRVLYWNDEGSDEGSEGEGEGIYVDGEVFTEGLSADISMSSDGRTISTIGFNISNDGFYSEVDWIAQVYDREGEGGNGEGSATWHFRGKAFSKSNHLPFYPTNQYLSKDGTTLAICGGMNTDSNDFADWRTRYHVYYYHDDDASSTSTSTSTTSTWKKKGNDVESSGGIVQMALSEDGNTLATVAWQSNNTLLGRIYGFSPTVVTSTSKVKSTTNDVRDADADADVDADVHTDGTWIPRGDAIVLPVIDQRIPVFSVSLSRDGLVMILRAFEDTGNRNGLEDDPNYDDMGFIFVYEYHDGKGWTLRAPKVTTTDAMGSSFGASGDANVFAVGGYTGPDKGGWETPRSYLNIFRFNGTQYVLQQKIGDDDDDDEENHHHHDDDDLPSGTSLALSKDGTFLVTGDTQKGKFTGAVRIYECNDDDHDNSSSSSSNNNKNTDNNTDNISNNDSNDDDDDDDDEQSPDITITSDEPDDNDTDAIADEMSSKSSSSSLSLLSSSGLSRVAKSSLFLVLLLLFLWR